jgi:hypothetical protein
LGKVKRDLEELDHGISAIRDLNPFPKDRGCGQDVTPNPSSAGTFCPAAMCEAIMASSAMSDIWGPASSNCSFSFSTLGAPRVEVKTALFTVSLTREDVK